MSDTKQQCDFKRLDIGILICKLIGKDNYELY